MIIPSFLSYQACNCVCWSPSSSKDSACLAAGYSDGTLRIFRIATSEMELKLHPHDGVAVTAIQYSAHGERQQPSPCFVSMLWEYFWISAYFTWYPTTAERADWFYTNYLMQLYMYLWLMLLSGPLSALCSLLHCFYAPILQKGSLIFEMFNELLATPMPHPYSTGLNPYLSIFHIFCVGRVRISSLVT